MPTLLGKDIATSSGQRREGIAMRLLLGGIVASAAGMGLLYPATAQVFGGPPESATLLLAGAGLVCLGALARRRMSKRTKQ